MYFKHKWLEEDKHVLVLDDRSDNEVARLTFEDDKAKIVCTNHDETNRIFSILSSAEFEESIWHKKSHSIDALYYSYEKKNDQSCILPRIKNSYHQRDH
jgi:Trk K+ transport system NAD-binding subunit